MLRQDIVEDMKAAMKAGDTDVRDTLRMLDSMIKNEEISTGAREKGLDDEGVLVLVKRGIKQRKDSASQYHDAGRAELAEQEEKEIAILEKYLPAQMSEEEVHEKVTQALQDAGLEQKSDMGKAMGLAMKTVGNQADGNTVRQVVNEILQ